MSDNKPRLDNRKEAGKLALQVFGIIRPLSTATLSRAERQFNGTTQTNCPWYTYRARGLAVMIRAELSDRELEKHLAKKNRRPRRKA